MKKVRLLILGTFLFHFFIIFGIAHGGAFIGAIEIIYFPYITNEHFTLAFDGTQRSSLSVVGLFGFMGNILLLITAFMKHITLRHSFHIGGILAYWVSIMYLWYDSAFLGHSQFNGLFCLPLLLFTIYTFIRKYNFKWYGWLRN